MYSSWIHYICEKNGYKDNLHLLTTQCTFKLNANKRIIQLVTFDVVRLLVDSSCDNHCQIMKLFLACVALVLFVTSKVDGAFTISKSGVIQAAAERCPSQVTQEDKEKCLLELCNAEQPEKFECRALGCKLKFPGKGVDNKKKILRCVKNVCKSSVGHSVCTGISECEDLRSKELGRAKYIICITKLFPRE